MFSHHFFTVCLNWTPQYILFNWPLSSHDTSHWNSVVWVHHGVLLCGMLTFQLYLHGSNSSLLLDPKANGRAHPASTSWPGLHLNGKNVSCWCCLSVAGIESCLSFQNILKRTKERTKEEQTASKALASVSKVNTPHSSASPLTTNPFNLTHERSTCLWKFYANHCVTDFLLIELHCDSDSYVSVRTKAVWVRLCANREETFDSISQWETVVCNDIWREVEL